MTLSMNDVDQQKYFDDIFKLYNLDSFEYIEAVNLNIKKLILVKLIFELLNIDVNFDKEEDFLQINFYWKDDGQRFGEILAKVDLLSEQTTD